MLPFQTNSAVILIFQSSCWWTGFYHFLYELFYTMRLSTYQLNPGGWHWKSRLKLLHSLIQTHVEEDYRRKKNQCLLDTSNVWYYLQYAKWGNASKMSADPSTPRLFFDSLKYTGRPEHHNLSQLFSQCLLRNTAARTTASLDGLFVNPLIGNHVWQPKHTFFIHSRFEAHCNSLTRKPQEANPLIHVFL